MVAFLNEGLPRIEPCFCGRGSKETGNERKVMKIRDFSAFIFPVQDAAVLKATFVCTESSISSLPERPKPRQTYLKFASTGRPFDDLVVMTRPEEDGRWRRSPSCLAACFFLYTTVLTV